MDKHLRRELDTLITKLQGLIEYVWVESMYPTKEATKILTSLDELCLRIEELKEETNK